MPASRGSILDAPATLQLDERLTSPDGKTVAHLQNDGHLVIHVDGKYIWGTHTNNRDVRTLEIQEDGNMVLYDSKRHAVWATNTVPPGRKPLAVELRCQDDSNLVLYLLRPESGLLEYKWASETHRVARTRLVAPATLSLDERIASPDGRTVLHLQKDGNLVLNVQGQYIWGTQTTNIDVRTFEVQEDGNIVLYDSQRHAVWATSSNPTAFKPVSVELRCQDDNNLVLYLVRPGDSSTLTYTWASETTRVVWFQQIYFCNGYSDRPIYPAVKDCRDGQVAWDAYYNSGTYWAIDKNYAKTVDFAKDLNSKDKVLAGVVGGRGMKMGISTDDGFFWHGDHTFIYSLGADQVRLYADKGVIKMA